MDCLISADTDPVTDDSALCSHTSIPSFAFNAYTWLSSDPMNTFPSHTAGDDFTLSPVANDHFTDPSLIFNAYTLSSSDPM